MQSTRIYNTASRFAPETGRSVASVCAAYLHADFQTKLAGLVNEDKDDMS